MRATVHVVAWCVFAAAVGCGGATGQATGKVTRNGVPVTAAEIAFTSTTDPEATVHGATGPGGVYHLSYITNGGLPPGKYKVAVAYYTLRNGKPLPDGEEGSTLRGDETKVIRHAVEFERDIVAGTNPHDFELNDEKKVVE